MSDQTCPICLSKYVEKPDRFRKADYLILVDCKACGIFKLEEEAWDDHLDPNTGIGSRLSDVCRARLGHRVKLASGPTPKDCPVIRNDFVKKFIDEGCPGPNPVDQANNLVRFIGNKVSDSGNPLDDLPGDVYTVIGAANPDAAVRLAIELIEHGTLTGVNVSNLDGMGVIDLNLTLAGWEMFQSLKTGVTHKNNGFIAMRFGDEVLDPFVDEVVKPAVKDGIGSDLVDMRDVARAGIIDNLMREQIRDSAFVIVDLTHDNLGAYWEAGYAEGLGKPVIYICEKRKFEEAKTHFDTNHSTTVLWSLDDKVTFANELIATLRRSLNLFETVN